MLKIALIALPLVVFSALAGVFGVRVLDGADRMVVPSALIGREMPRATFLPLAEQMPGFDPAAFTGQPMLVNVFASWCAPCRVEHPLLMDLAKTPGLTVAGINFKDRADGALSFLAELGNPYDAVGVDPDGRKAIEWGVYGVPETFVVGSDGTIRAKHVGPLTEADINGAFGDAMRAAIREAAASS
ncbi:MAG: DsbE family thiol:disulfide interchange protein [Pseudomonadota bacterium]